MRKSKINREGAYPKETEKETEIVLRIIKRKRRERRNRLAMYNFLYMPFLYVFCGYRGINLGVHNKTEGNLEIKNTLFQFWIQGHFDRLQNILASLVLKKYILFLFLSLLVNDSILIYLDTTILYICNFLILYGHQEPTPLLLKYDHTLLVR